MGQVGEIKILFRGRCECTFNPLTPHFPTGASGTGGGEGLDKGKSCIPPGGGDTVGKKTTVEIELNFAPAHDYTVQLKASKMHSSCLLC